MKKELGVILLVFVATVGLSGALTSGFFSLGTAQISTISSGTPEAHPAQVNAARYPVAKKYMEEYEKQFVWLTKTTINVPSTLTPQDRYHKFKEIAADYPKPTFRLYRYQNPNNSWTVVVKQRYKK